jgi:VWFA-related protein
MRAILVVAGMAALLGAARIPQPQPPRPPVFRAGAHFVRVDAYPITKDGRIVEGLTKDDFEIYEDGAPQTIETSEFITFDTWTPEAERRDPRSQAEGFALAADPRYRVFAIVIDREAFDMVGWNVMRRPLQEFLERTLGPHDLFGLLSSKRTWNDFVLGQKTTVIKRELDKREWWTTKDDLDDEELALLSCGLASLIGRSRADRTYALLEGLVRLLGAIREERKSIVYVANGLPNSGSGNMPASAPAREMPKIGVTGGRLGPMPRDGIPGGVTGNFCNAERQRLTSLDFGARFRELLTSARQSNVAFYPISPKGLQGLEFTAEGRADLAGLRRDRARTDSLLTLASETDGVAIVNTNDLRAGMTRIANDLQAYYVLGYYTTNSKWDGGLRSIKVRLLPKHDTIRARRQYRAPTQSDIAALSAAGLATAPAAPSAEARALARLTAGRPSAQFWTYAAVAGPEVSVVLEMPADTAAASRWLAGAQVQALVEAADGDVIGAARGTLAPGDRGLVLRVALDRRAPPSALLVRVRTAEAVLTDRVPLLPASTLVGDAVAYRNGTPAAVLVCARTDVIRFEWPILTALDSREVRLLDRTGHPLSIRLPLSENGAGPDRVLSAALPLAPLARGEYLIELVARRAAVSERKLVALSVR